MWKAGLALTSAQSNRSGNASAACLPIAGLKEGEDGVKP